MHTKFLMGESDGLVRVASDNRVATVVSADLRNRLLSQAIDSAMAAYAEFFGKKDGYACTAEMRREYESDFAEAFSLGLMCHGGIRAKDHLNLWCLAKVLLPQTYIESGVFVGSSLHAVIRGAKSSLSHVIAVDPRLEVLRVPKDSLPNGRFVDQEDFSELEFGDVGRDSLAYFDDHIDTAGRIMQASAKGVRYVLFDDSTGFEGICQRLYPAIPTVPMIVHEGLLRSGDEFHWSVSGSVPGERAHGLLERIGRRIRGGDKRRSSIVRVSCLITDAMIERCDEARKCIVKWMQVPDLGRFIPQDYPEKTVDSSKFLLELHNNHTDR